jgi:hypothetical protein
MRSALLHFLFMLAAAALASYVWLDRWTPRGDLPVLLEADVDELQSATYRWPNGTTQVVREGKGKARTYVVTLTHSFDAAADQRAAAAMSDPKNRLAMKTGTDPAQVEKTAREAEKPGPLSVETLTFPPGLFSIASIQKLTPLRARRGLGDMPADEIRNMGLAPSQRSLAVSARGRTLALDIGNETFGGQAFYARSQADGGVYLLDAELVRAFETTPRAMMDPRIVTVPLSDVTGLVLEMDGRKSEFVQKNKDQFRARYFVRKDDPEKKAEAVDGLNSTFVGLKAAEFLAAAPPGKVLATIRFLRDGAEPHEVRLQQDAAGTYTILSGRWIAPLPEADARKILEEVRAAL